MCLGLWFFYTSMGSISIQPRLTLTNRWSSTDGSWSPDHGLYLWYHSPTDRLVPDGLPAALALRLHSCSPEGEQQVSDHASSWSHAAWVQLHVPTWLAWYHHRTGQAEGAGTQLRWHEAQPVGPGGVAPHVRESEVGAVGGSATVAQLMQVVCCAGHGVAWV